MATFEEQAVKSYYNLKGYFTIENISFPSKEKKKGGRNRGEIDLIAIKIDRNSGKVKEAIHIEVSPSLTENFPFISDNQADEVRKLLKKFFISDSDFKLKEFYEEDYKFQFVSGRFGKDAEERLKRRLEELGAEVLDIRMEGESILVKVRYEGKTKEIRIVQFTNILKELIMLTKGRREYSFNPIIRALQWFNCIKEHF